MYDFVNKLDGYEDSRKDDINIVESLKKIINQVSENIETFQFNKSVAKIYEFVNILNESISVQKLSRKNFEWSLEKLSIILQPFVPHVSEEIWWSLKKEETLCINQDWPKEIEKKEIKFKIAVQINGKTKEIIEVDQNISRKEVLEIIKMNSKIKKNLIDKEVVREIYVEGKIINLVVK